MAERQQPQTTEYLLHRVAAGDTHAVTECVDRFGGLIWSIARRFLASAADAEDAVQEVFIALWKNAHRYDPAIASETTFVTMIARRRLIDRKRRDARRVESEAVTIDDLPISEPETEAEPIEVFDEAAKVAAAVSQLRPEQQKVLQLAVCHGWTHQVIAERLSLPLGTVKTHVRRGLIKVRELLEADTHGDQEAES